MKEQWILYDISDRMTARNGVDEYFIVYLFNTKTKEKASSYITIGFRNNDWWGDVILNDRFGIYKFEILRFDNKSTGKYGKIINGDSIPVLETECTKREAASLMDIIKA
jgi:hypothetical protein|tara:strand:- start:234 stop:560 length:327 start_codon:yes stop_codon:yes gene_type:complete